MKLARITARPLLTLGYPFRDYTWHSRPRTGVYTNATCARVGCGKPHDTVRTTYCTACNELPSCDTCGDVKADCDALGECEDSASFDPCDDDGYSHGGYRRDPDRERFGCQ